MIQTLNHLLIIEDIIDRDNLIEDHEDEKVQDAITFLQNDLHQQIVKDIYVQEFVRVARSYESMRLIYESI